MSERESELTRLSAKHSALWASASEIENEYKRYNRPSTSASYEQGLADGVKIALDVIQRRLERYEKAIADLVDGE